MGRLGCVSVCYLCGALRVAACQELYFWTVTVQSHTALEPSPLGHQGRVVKKHLGALSLDSGVCRCKIRGLEEADSVKEHLFML